MLIDWFTVSVQIINFLILIVLLKKFLYGPIIRAMDEREKEIAGRLSGAATARREAEAKEAKLTREQEEFARARGQMALTAQKEIEQWKEESLARLKDDIAEQSSKWQQSLAEEQEAFLQKLKIHISRQVFMVAQKTLADLADDSLEGRLLEAFFQKVKEEPGVIVENSMQTAKLQVTTGFSLIAEQKELLKTRLASLFPSYEELEFKEDENLGFGMHLLAGDQKWEWNLSRYMKDIEKEIINSMSKVAREK